MVLILLKTSAISSVLKALKYSPSVFTASVCIKRKSAPSVKAMPKIRIPCFLHSKVRVSLSHFSPSRSSFLFPVSTIPSVKRMIKFWAVPRPLFFSY